jgi:hypothetical protein
MILSNTEVDNVCEWIINNCPAYIERYKEIMQVMYSTGCRVSEAVLRSSWTFTSTETWTLKPNKESWERAFEVSSLPQNWVTHFQDVTDVIHLVNYRKFQYQINNMTRQFELKSGVKSINSHIFRHNYIRTLSDSGLTPTQVQQQIGHKSLSSTQGYLNAVVTAQTLPPFNTYNEFCPIVYNTPSGSGITWRVGSIQEGMSVKKIMNIPSWNYHYEQTDSYGGTSHDIGNFGQVYSNFQANIIINGVEQICKLHEYNPQ